MSDPFEKEMIPVSQVILDRLTDTQTNIEGLRTDTKAQIERLRTDTKTQIEGLRTEAKADKAELTSKIEGLRKETKADIQSVNARIDRMVYSQVAFAIAIVIHAIFV